MPRCRHVAPVLLAALLAACGTTVPAAQQQLGGSSGLGTSGDLTATTSGGTATGGTTGTALGGSTGGSASSLGTGTGSTAVPGTATGAAPSTSSGSAPVAGVTDKTPVRVGFELIRGGNAAISAAFGTPVNFGDGKLEVTAIVDDINAHGGLNGRKILPFFASWDVASKDAGREATCRSLAEDSKVTFMITVINLAQPFISCAAKHGIPVINSSLGAGDLTIYQQYGSFLFSPGMMNLDRELRLVLETAHSARRISPSTKVGVIVDSVEDPQYQRVYKRTVDPLLTRYGVPHESFAVQQQSDVSAAVLRFSTDGVKVVFWVAPSGVIEILFMQTAEQQRYRPDYGMGDSSSTWFVGSTAPPEQVKHIFGVGSLPLANIDSRQYPTTPREKACLDLIRKKGENNGERHSSITATVYCEAIYAFQAVAERVSGRLTPASFRSAYAGVGTGYAPVTTFRTDFANGRHDNASAYRLMAYRDSCTCVTYTSGVLPLPA